MYEYDIESLICVCVLYGYAMEVPNEAHEVRCRNCGFGRVLDTDAEAEYVKEQHDELRDHEAKVIPLVH